MAMGDGSQSNVKLVRMDHNSGLHYYHVLQLEVVDPVLPLHLLCWLGLQLRLQSSLLVIVVVVLAVAVEVAVAVVLVVVAVAAAVPTLADSFWTAVVLRLPLRNSFCFLAARLSSSSRHGQKAVARIIALAAAAVRFRQWLASHHWKS